MLSKRYESTEVDRRTWLHVPSGTHWSTSSDTHQVVVIQIETSTKMYTPFLNRIEGISTCTIISPHVCLHITGNYYVNCFRIPSVS